MSSQVDTTITTNPLDHNLHVGEGHNEKEEPHGEKQSVFKKMKVKAKKIKDSIKGHVGQGHDNDHDDDENDDEIDTKTVAHGAPATRGIDISKEGTAGQHGTDVVGKPSVDGINAHKEGTAGQHGTDIHGGHEPVSYSGVDQVFNPTTTHYVPGQEETLSQSRIDSDTLAPLASENKPHALSLTPDIAQSTGSHSTGNMGVTQKPKLGGIIGKDSHVLDHVEELDAPIEGGIGKEGISPHGTNIAGGATLGSHSPVGNLDSPGAFQDFVPTTTHYVPGQEETLGWSRTDTGPVLGSDQSQEVTHRPAVASSGGLEKDFHVPKHVGEDAYPADYPAKVDSPIGGGAQDIGLGLGGGTGKRHGDYPQEEESDIPVSESPVEYQTFDTTSSIYIPGEEETLGRSRTDHTERSPSLSDEQPYAPKSTPVVGHEGKHHAGALGTGTTETGESTKFGGIIDRSTSLEKDPHSPTGRRDEEIEVTPILQQLGKMNIHDRSSERPDSNVTSGQPEDLFTPSPDISANPSSQGLHDEHEQKPESYTEKVSSLASELANKAKVATGYGASDETAVNVSAAPPVEYEQKPESYTEKASSLASTLANKAKVATGYGASDGSPPNVSAAPVEHEQKPESYTDKASSLASTLANKAKVATGYGASDGTPTNVSSAPVDEKISTGSHDQLSPEPVTAHQFDSTNPSGLELHDENHQKPESYTEKISSLASGLATKAKVATGYGATNETPTNAPASPVGETDKGVSVKEYLGEKLKPGEGDKALSEVITEALPLHTSKKESPVNGATESDKEKEVVVVKGRVTESEEVANRLGRAEDTNFDGVGPGLASPGKSVMNRIMDATGSWFGGKTEPATEPVHSSEEAGTSIKETQEK